MFLHYLVKLEMLIVHVLPLSCYRKNSGIYPTLTVPPNSRDLNLVDYSGWELLQRKVYKICITLIWMN